MRSITPWVVFQSHFRIVPHDLGLQVVGEIEGFLQRMLEKLTTLQIGFGQGDMVLVDADIGTLQEQLPVGFDDGVSGDFLAHRKYTREPWTLMYAPPTGLANSTRVLRS